MKTLILMRHAKSGWDNPDLRDRDRPLNKRGQRAAPMVGAWLAEKGYVPDVALVSDARRTQETWALLGLDTKHETLASLYLAEPDEILAEVAKISADSVLVLGHNPGIGELSAELCAQWPKHEQFMRFPTASVCVLRFEAGDWGNLAEGSGTLADFVTPSDL